MKEQKDQALEDMLSMQALHQRRRSLFVPFDPLWPTHPTPNSTPKPPSARHPDHIAWKSVEGSWVQFSGSQADVCGCLCDVSTDHGLPVSMQKAASGEGGKHEARVGSWLPAGVISPAAASVQQSLTLGFCPSWSLSCSSEDGCLIGPRQSLSDGWHVLYKMQPRAEPRAQGITV